MRLVTPLQMMRIEEEADRNGTSYEMMMDRAGYGLAGFLQNLMANYQVRQLLFLCGSGNNAGDCFVAAQTLAKLSEITICMVNGVPKTRTAYAKFKKLTDIRVLTTPSEIERAVDEATIVVDGVFGIGFRNELGPELRKVFACAEKKICVAVDIPSGGDGLTGAVSEGTIHCDYTVTFGAGKYGMLQMPLLEYCGEIISIDIGIPPVIFDTLDYPMFMLTQDEVKLRLPQRPMNAQKGDFGKMLCVSGSMQMPGAAILASSAAMRCGVGTLTLASVTEPCRLLISTMPEAMLLPLPAAESGCIAAEAVPAILAYAKNCTSVLIGCGLGRSEDTKQLVCALLSNLDCPIVLDADGLNVIADCIDILHKVKAPLVITPHPGEMSRLLQIPIPEVQKDRVGCAKRFAQRFPQVTVVLKGAGTVVANQKRAYINTTGNSGMSKGGSGDVLAGMIASLTAQGISPEYAARIGVYLHGAAGDLAAEAFSRRAMLPSDLIRELPVLFARLEREAENE